MQIQALLGKLPLVKQAAGSVVMHACLRSLSAPYLDDGLAGCEGLLTHFGCHADEGIVRQPSQQGQFAHEAQGACSRGVLHHKLRAPQSVRRAVTSNALEIDDTLSCTSLVQSV